MVVMLSSLANLLIVLAPGVGRSMPATPNVHPLAIVIMFALMASVVAAWTGLVLRLAFRLPILPAFEPRRVPWGGKSVVVAILLWLAIQIVGQYAFVYATHGTIGRPRKDQEPLKPSEMMVASAIQNMVVLVAVPLLLAVTSGARRRDYGLTGTSMGRRIAQGVVAWPLTTPLVYGMMLVAVAIWGKGWHPLERAIQTEGIGQHAVIFFLASAVFAPMAEELIFRGVLLGWLTSLVLKGHTDRVDSLLGTPHDSDQDPEPPTEPWPVTDGLDDLDNPFAAPRTAIHPPMTGRDAAPVTPLEPLILGTRVRLILANVAVSLLFAALHAAVWPTPVPIFFLSLALGLLYQRTGSLIGSMSLHMTFNALSTILMFLTLGNTPNPVPPAPLKPPTSIPSPIPQPVMKPVG